MGRAWVDRGKNMSKQFESVRGEDRKGLLFLNDKRGEYLLEKYLRRGLADKVSKYVFLCKIVVS